MNDRQIINLAITEEKTNLELVIRKQMEEYDLTREEVLALNPRIRNVMIVLDRLKMKIDVRTTINQL